MSIYTFSSREFTREVSAAKRAAMEGPVFISGRILPFTENTAPVCANMHVPNPKSERDAMIAATALEHGFSVVTRNVADFANVGVAIVNPWEP